MEAVAANLAALLNDSGMSPLFAGLLIGVGLVAGIINTLAGGGSNLTIPALMVMGMPADVANATNRLGVFFQALVASAGFYKHKRLEPADAWQAIKPTLAGSLLGALLAVLLPLWLLKPLLLMAMLSVALLILLRPNLVIPSLDEQPKAVDQVPYSRSLLFVCGVYGGFVQAGVGFILILACSGLLRFDLVRANALKMAATLAFTSLSLFVFIAFDLIRWLPGLVLASGAMVGAWLAVKLSLNLPPTIIKWFLFAMTLVACIAAAFSD